MCMTGWREQTTGESFKPLFHTKTDRHLRGFVAGGDTVHLRCIRLGLLGQGVHHGRWSKMDQAGRGMAAKGSLCVGQMAYGEIL